MYLCYIDESGTSSVPGNTSHFILAGISMPIWNWRDADREVTAALSKYDLENEELHTAWLLRAYLEQRRIPGFDNMDRAARRAAVIRQRTAHLLKLQRAGNAKAYRQVKKNYEHTSAYVHLTFAERISVAKDIADVLSRWAFARVFGECIDKIHFDPAKTGRTVDEQAFEQVISRFQHYLAQTPDIAGKPNLGLVVHDNNQTVAKKHTELMRHFHGEGTLWTKIDRIIETPLFVDSRLTRMVQLADLCSYSLRRYAENGEADLFRRIFKRADRVNNRAVSVRHFAGLSCKCEICDAHHRGKWIPALA